LRHGSQELALPFRRPRPPLLRGQEDLKAALAALRRAEFIHEQAINPVIEYSFKHP